ncbi:MAG TPA: multiheme c-type cytochrome [Polyangiaceae bacterium]
MRAVRGSRRTWLLAFALYMALLAGGCDRRSKPSPTTSPSASAAEAVSNDPLAALPLDATPIDWSRPVPTTPPGGLTEPGYVGSEACKDCHKDVYLSYARHSMARTGPRPLVTLDRKWLAQIFDAGAAQPVVHERSGFTYRPFRKGNDYFVEELVVAPDGTRVQSWVEQLGYAYSAGSYGMAFYFRQGTRLYQIPIDYYAKARVWGVDPSFADGGNVRFSKTLGSFCISCHTDYPRRQAGTDDVFLEPLPAGVGCERCHGPGQKHVATLRAADIVNPARLSTTRQVEVCAQCHESSHSNLRAHREEFSYRPGEPLGAYRVNFVGEPPEPDRFILLAHPERMIRSACWRASGGKLTCTSCHDPHKSSFEQPATWWDAKCNECHHDHPCTESAEARAAQGDHCVTCHMRTGPASSPTLVSITDHWIQRRPPPIRPGADRPQHLEAWPDLVGEPAPGDDLVVLEAMAYSGAGQHETAEKLAASAHGDALRMPMLDEMLARHYTAAGQPWNAARSYASLLDVDPNEPGPLFTYARLMLDRGPGGVSEATHALDRLLALDPDDVAALETKAMFLFRGGHVEEATPLFTRAASVGPSAGASHVALALLAQRENRDTQAIAELELARRIEPGNTWILERLRAAYAKAGDAAHGADIDRASKYFASRKGGSPTGATWWLPEGWR